MSAPSALKILLQLTQQQADSSARKLGKLNFQQQEAEKKLNLLLQYRHSYQLHLQNSMEQGINQMEWLNFIAFINKLDTAISEQRQVVLHAQSKRIAASNEFLSYQCKLKSYNTLSQRQQNAENQNQIKYEQKLQDEFTSNTLSRNSSSKKDSW
ncbi:flagellar export protein FliJ [Nitrosomonas sp. Nm166]|uniref:flagellar export protein FliJ n=1 Tax=Nitrosomonas sp. Nm166 TaxID=1881054 RepID=UPI0008E3CBAA|nr:flagellar export protein FliJ [Nitrosomonas sp. Nm166]SFE99124.1 flagellar FliJ protein [Nitrosomonas sp. Nm166]